jgi:hypothetical protein
LFADTGFDELAFEVDRFTGAPVDLREGERLLDFWTAGGRAEDR